MIACNLFTFIRATSGARCEHGHVISTASLTDCHPISESTFVENFLQFTSSMRKALAVAFGVVTKYGNSVKLMWSVKMFLGLSHMSSRLSLH
jgi:hypothetical protein